jgi:hypothetical protein
VLCVHHIAAIDSASAAYRLRLSSLALSKPVVSPTEPPCSPPRCTCCATYSTCTPSAVDPPPPPTVDPALPFSILDDPNQDVQVKRLIPEALRIIDTIVSEKCILTVSVITTSTLLRYLGYPTFLSLPRSITVRYTLKPRLLNATKVFRSILDLSCNLPKMESVFVAQRLVWRNV